MSKHYAPKETIRVHPYPAKGSHKDFKHSPIRMPGIPAWYRVGLKTTGLHRTAAVLWPKNPATEA